MKETTLFFGLIGISAIALALAIVEIVGDVSKAIVFFKLAVEALK